MKKAIKDNYLLSSYHCPDCHGYTNRMTVTHPWRLWCDKCKQELENPDYPDHYPREIGEA